MASAKFLEEALSTDVDESAVNAIVGSLETQLVTSSPAVAGHSLVTSATGHQNHHHQLTTGISNGGSIPSAVQKHGVANGGGTTTVNNSLMTQEVTKSITTTTLLPVNVVSSSQVVVSTQHQQQHHQQHQQHQQHQHQVQQHQQHQQHQQQHVHTVSTSGGNISSAGSAFPINQVQVTSNQQQPSNIALTKAHESVKLIYNPAVAGQVVTSGVVNVNNKLTFPAQTVGQLANGTLGVSSQGTVLQSASNVVVSNVGSVVTQSGQQTVVGGVNKPGPGTALVIKTSGAPGGMVSVPMSVPASVAGNVVTTTLQAKAGGVASSIVPSNVQFVNVNAVRPGTPVAGQQPGKQVAASRVVIGPHIVNTRPGGPGITLQTLHGLQPGTQGHLIVKTENGQYQLLRVGPVSATPGGNAVPPNNIAGNAVVASTPGATAYRLTSVPAVSRLNAQFTGPPLATIRKPVQTVAPSVTTTTVTPGTVVSSTTTATPATTPATTTPVAQTPQQRQTADNTKEKCRKFLANLLELSSREPKAVERNVRSLIQELIDTKVEPEEFCDRLEKLLNASPQPCLIGFLKKSLPLLRQSLVTKELVIDGIKPPPPNVVYSIASSPIITQNQIRPTVAMSTVPVVVSSSPAPLRVMAPPSVVTSTVGPRAPQAIPSRLIRPMTTIVRTPVAHTVKSTVALTNVRLASPTVQKSPITTSTLIKTIPTATQGKTVNAATTVNKTTVPSLVTKPPNKEKEKKTFSSAGYTGDDDINDVAAMGGVNLAEESQRILGSTEFVGTQIRSCKDEVFLHVSPLQQRIKQIVSSYGLEEPNQEVAALISHATQERVERRRHEEQERELLLKAAKSRAKNEDPEQAKLKAKAKEMQRAEMEELRQREANLTALQAIGPRKKPKLDTGSSTNNPGGSASVNASASGVNRPMPMRPRVKRVNFRDLLFLLEQEKESCRSTTLYKAYLK
ncbi:Similar to Taf4: Transcription initiation factor TFIID subunit 4 (Drosophila melanogaster) [Cotesia congregata]|uniref:Similar to Taf4: Transcription initiation factor TFIID subunit 4 (Drosophila melanogaster) n=1 Tax=Cotesia congregata TaxID=51543 RepID=A0A8J2H707_COTCN|nr:Similar to Taf4: Transcription initiation factor TFIID subunit 4 (Drosophila melanogaster) [Cotesia congregata]